MYTIDIFDGTGVTWPTMIDVIAITLLWVLFFTPFWLCGLAWFLER